MVDRRLGIVTMAFNSSISRLARSRALAHYTSSSASICLRATPHLRSIAPLGRQASVGFTRGHSVGSYGRRGGPGDAGSIRFMSGGGVEIPEPPTSSHPHVPNPGATGQLIYTET